MADESSNGGPHRLRWWNDNDAVVPGVSGAFVRLQGPIVVPEPVTIDVGEELENEALRRAASNASVALVEIYSKPEVINARMLKNMLIASGLIAVMASTEAIVLHDPWKLILLPIFVVEAVFIGKVMSNIVRRQHHPVVTLTKAGLEVHSFLQNIGLVPWDEIEEIGVFNCVERCVGIVPKNSEALCRRLPALEAFCVRANSRFCRLFPPRMRKAMAPITLSSRVLPISVDDLVAQIEKFRMENAV